MSLTIEAGKFYKTRQGFKAKVYEVYNEYAHGAVLVKSQWNAVEWFRDGVIFTRSFPEHMETGADIVSAWIDPPVVDWDKLPPGILSVAIDKGGEEYGYLTTNVSATGYEWIAGAPNIHIGSLSLWYCRLPDGTIRFSGDWRDSLVIRPGYKEAKQ